MSEPVSVPGLRVEWGYSDPSNYVLRKKQKRVWRARGGWAWRVVQGRACPIPCEFARRADAERAMLAIADMTDWTADPETIRAKVEPKEVLRRMVECLAW